MLSPVRVALVALAGAVGAVCRYGVGVAVGAQAFPWTTLGVNLSGSLVLGMLLGARPGWLSDNAVVAAGAGFLGAFTTFSAFGYEVHALLRHGRSAAALAYVATSVVAGVVLAGLGWSLGRSLAD